MSSEGYSVTVKIITHQLLRINQLTHTYKGKKFTWV